MAASKMNQAFIFINTKISLEFGYGLSPRAALLFLHLKNILHYIKSR